jgi:hypothetical protein
MTFRHFVGKCVCGSAAPMPVSLLGPCLGIGAVSAPLPVRLASAIAPSDNPVDAKKCRRVSSRAAGLLKRVMGGLGLGYCRLAERAVFSVVRSLRERLLHAC